MTTFTKIVDIHSKASKNLSERKYQELIESLPSGFGDIQNMKGTQAEVLSALRAKVSKMFEPMLKKEASKVLVSKVVPKYTGRLFRGSVVVFIDTFTTEGVANRRIAEELLFDSSITGGSVEGMGITIEIDRLKASAILSSRGTVQATKSLSFGGGKLWSKASQTRVCHSKGLARWQQSRVVFTSSNPTYCSELYT